MVAIDVRWLAPVQTTAADRETRLQISGGFCKSPWLVNEADLRVVEGRPFIRAAVNNYQLAMLLAGRVNDPAPRGRVLARLGVLQRLWEARDAGLVAKINEVKRTLAAEAEPKKDSDAKGSANTLERLGMTGSGRSKRRRDRIGTYMMLLPKTFDVSVRLTAPCSSSGSGSGAGSGSHRDPEIFTVLPGTSRECAWIEATPAALNVLLREMTFVLTEDRPLEAATPPRRQRSSALLRQNSGEKVRRKAGAYWNKARHAFLATAFNGEKMIYKTFPVDEKEKARVEQAKAQAKQAAMDWVKENQEEESEQEESLERPPPRKRRRLHGKGHDGSRAARAGRAAGAAASSRRVAD